MRLIGQNVLVKLARGTIADDIRQLQIYASKMIQRDVMATSLTRYENIMVVALPRPIMDARRR